MSALSPILRSLEGGLLAFWCPGCDEVHAVKVREGAAAGPSWTWNGNVDAPTFQPSILIRSGHYASHYEAGKHECWCTYDAAEIAAGRLPSGFSCSVCHSFVTDGQIQFLGDCTHKLAGQTVPLPAWTNDEHSPKEKTMTLLEGMKAAIAAKNDLIAKTQAEVAAIEETIKTHGAALEVEAETFLQKLEAEAHVLLDKAKAVIASVRAHL